MELKLGSTRVRTGMKGVVAAIAVAAVMVVTPGAVAGPPHGEGGHVHHVITGNGDCVGIDAVAFFPEERGLHQGADASGNGNGPWHGGCP